jgi:hypothetical protein
MLVCTICVLTIPQILRTKFEIEIEKQKKNLTRIVSQKDKSTNDTIHVSVCLFCSSLCISNLGLKNLGIVNTHLVNTHIFSNKIYALENLNFKERVA